MANTAARGSMANFLVVVTVVGLMLICGLAFDHFRRDGYKAECERAGGVYVLGMSDFACATAQQVRQ